MMMMMMMVMMMMIMKRFWEMVNQGKCFNLEQDIFVFVRDRHHIKHSGTCTYDFQ